nr:metalloregulator ArsR/SmtB family transcription factor [Kibdelosporangium sp. MJ126-NF4]
MSISVAVAADGASAHAADAHPDVAEAAVKLFGDPLRAEIVRLLAREQMCTCHLVDELDACQSTISHHIRVLRDAGMVAAERHGRFTYYRLRPEAVMTLIAGLADMALQVQHAQTVRRPCP